MPYRRIDVLYEDDCCVVFNKPSGLLVVPTPQKESNTLVDIVNSRSAEGMPQAKLLPCHRLDRDTSGLILFAKGPDNEKKLMEQFKAGRIKKKYIALVHGKMRQKAGEIKGYIRDLDQIKFQKHKPAKWAATKFKVLEVHKHFSVVEVVPVTGRTNQIRIHFAQIGHPLLGERKYAFGRDFHLRFKRTALHALELGWHHPRSNKLIECQAPWPKDMAEAVSGKISH